MFTYLPGHFEVKWNNVHKIISIGPAPWDGALDSSYYYVISLLFQRPWRQKRDLIPLNLNPGKEFALKSLRPTWTMKVTLFWEECLCISQDGLGYDSVTNDPES